MVVLNCKGPIQYNLSLLCSNDGATLKADIEEIYNETCQEELTKMQLTRDMCSNEEQKELNIFCAGKEDYWALEDKCNGETPMNMDKKTWYECRCSRQKLFQNYKIQEHLETVKICFNRVTKSPKTNFVSRLSLIGGTLGLFSGFSILSGFEIIFYIFKALHGIF